MILLPIERCWRAAIRLRNRGVLRFTCLNIITAQDGPRLSRIDVKGQRGFPLFVQLRDVVGVTYRRGWRWRRLGPVEGLIWFTTGALMAALDFVR